jgi:hypothetical protein
MVNIVHSVYILYHTFGIYIYIIYIYIYMLPAIWIIQVFCKMLMHYINCQPILVNVNKTYDFQYYLTYNLGIL